MKRSITLLTVAFSFLLATAPSTVAQSEEGYRIYDSAGTELAWEDVISKTDVEVVLVGETHDDSIGHKVEWELLTRLYAAQTDTSEPSVAISMEMFTRDVQHVVDEYLGDVITESHFLKASQPWDRYETDYKPLVEFAKAHGLPVIAANAPRRYVNRVTRLGSNALNDLHPVAKNWVAPLPFAQASPEYEKKWMKQMEESMAEMGAEGMDHSMFAHMLEAQSLWDATMAHSIVTQLIKQPAAKVVHYVGSFHVTQNTGILEHIHRYRPGTSALTIVLEPSTDIMNPSEDDLKLGDVVILTHKVEEEGGEE